MKKKRIIHIILILFIISTSIGYSLLTSNLEIQGEVSISKVDSILLAVEENNEIAFRSTEYKTKIKTITFENKINVPETAVASWDIGVSQIGNVMAYLLINEEDNTLYDLYIQGNNTLYANENMSWWFSGFENLTEIININLLDTSKTTDMSWLFSGSAKLTELNLNSWDTKNVLTIQGIFSETHSLEKLYVNDWDTSKMKDMGLAFHNTKSLTELDVSKWNTSNVTNLYGIFYGAE